MRQMQSVAITIVLVLASVPAANAQGRRGGGRRSGGENEGGRGVQAMKLFSDADLDKSDPGRVLLDKAKALKLSDAQKMSLDSVIKRYEWNAHQFAKIADSLATAARRERRGRGSDATTSPDSGGADERVTHRALLDALQSIRDEFDAAASHSTERLTDDQKKQADSLIQDARAKLEKLLSRA